MQTGDYEVTQSIERVVIDAEDRRKHLDFIQAVVTRMSSASSTAKGWLLPVVTGAYGFALTQSDRSVAILGIGAVLLFGFLDANYLRQEKAYRRLYDAVARGTREIPVFSLDSSHANDPMPAAATRLQKVRLLLGRWFPGRDVWLSWSIAPFYGAFVVIGCLIASLVN
jgi:histidine triad (HIT) family protein